MVLEGVFGLGGLYGAVELAGFVWGTRFYGLALVVDGHDAGL